MKNIKFLIILFLIVTFSNFGMSPKYPTNFKFLNKLNLKVPQRSITLPKVWDTSIHTPKKLPKEGMDQLQGKFPFQVTNLIKFIRHREKYERMGAHFPTGLLLIGKPGTGKTSIGRSIAEELKAPFIYTSANQFYQKWYGESERAVREFFLEAHKETENNEIVIAFLDELDALGSRSDPGNMGHTHKSVLTTFMTELDGRNDHKNRNLYVFGASNDSKKIDPALKRPGRFDRIIEIPLPDKESRETILRFYAKAIRYNKEQVDFEELSNLTQGYTPADLKHFVNEAALNAVQENDDHVTMENFFYSYSEIEKRKNLSEMCHLGSSEECQDI